MIPLEGGIIQVREGIHAHTHPRVRSRVIERVRMRAPIDHVRIRMRTSPARARAHARRGTILVMLTEMRYFVFQIGLGVKVPKPH